MSLQCGIVGLPNVGKSTLFNALTKAGIAAENYPFCTIEPNVGIVELPDPRLGQLAEIVKPERIVPATSPAMSTNSTIAGTMRSGLTISASCASRVSGSSTMPTFGSIVQNG